MGGHRLVLAVAPEGTRSGTLVWKSGFYRIALRANVPLLITVLDYGSRTICVRGLYQPTGDYEADLPAIREKYAGAKGRHPAKFSIADDDSA